jgi:hypothetical protein
MSNLGIHHIPGQSRFTQRLRERIENDAQWSIVHRNKGDMVLPQTLVTGVMSFPAKL